jgi:hypothetical protein
MIYRRICGAPSGFQLDPATSSLLAQWTLVIEERGLQTNGQEFLRYPSDPRYLEEEKSERELGLCS